MNEALREFDLGDGHDVELDEHISTIEALSDELSDEDIARLWAVLQGRAQAISSATRS